MLLRKCKDAIIHKCNKKLVAWLASLYATVRNRRLCLVSNVDHYWVHKHRDGVLVDLGLCLQTRAELFAATADYYNDDYRIRPGDVVFDIGAGIGYETLCFAATCGPGGKVFSFEAVPSLFFILQQNIARNALSNVTACNAAISNTCGQIYFQEMPQHVESRVVFSGGRDNAVDSLTVDSVVEHYGLATVDFVKMNIEGFERYAIEGMRHSIDKVRHVSIACHDFLAERNQDPNLKTLALVRTFLEDNHFRCQLRSDDKRPWIAHTISASRA